MKERIIDLIKSNVEELEDVEITETTELISGGFIESFDVISLISEIENEFNIDISFDDIELEQFNTIESIISIIEKFSK